MASIDERLRHPANRVGEPTTAYITEARLQPVGRWKRTRQWARHDSADAFILPWIVLNPAGNAVAAEEGTPQKLSKSGAGWTMAALSWRWGFDGFTAYNVFPYEAKKPEDLPGLVQKLGSVAISESHGLIAEDLRDADAVMCAWGEEEQIVRTWSRSLLSVLENSQKQGIAKWCVKQNRDGSPRHASRILFSSQPVAYRPAR